MRAGRRAPPAGAAAALAAVLIAAPGRAADLEGGGRAFLVGPECRVREQGPIDCDPVTEVRAVVGEHVQVQLVLEGGSGATPVRLRDAARPGPMIFVPVTRRSRGPHGDDALPWAASARPADATILGSVAEPFVHYAPSARSFELAPGERRVFWCSIPIAWRGPEAIAFFEDEQAGPRLSVERIDTPLPRPVVSFFAYVERDEIAARAKEPAGIGPQASIEVHALLQNAGVQAVDRVTRPEELGFQIFAPLDRDGSSWPRRDLVVLGAYGAFGEPSDEAVDRVVQLAGLVPERVRDVVLYAIDEDCASDLGPRWRARLAERATGPASRVKVLVTCSEDPAKLDVDVVMTTAERFDPDAAARARAAGKEVWVYNGRLPQAGPMALDAPPESLLWNGWIAARYDVRRWFLWNTNHWSDRNRGGHGPRDVYADPETFHNADGDAVLYDGMLLFPATEHTREIDPEPHAAIPGARLARLHRGIEDAGLLALAGMVDPAAAAAALDGVVPRALADVRDDDPVPFGDARAIVAARATLHAVIARGVAEGILPRASAAAGGPPRPAAGDEEPRTSAHPGLVRVRAALLPRVTAARIAELARPDAGRRRPLATTVATGMAVATCLVGLAIAALRLARRRIRR